MNLLTILGVREILCSCRLVLEGKTGKEKPESSRLEFLETFLANNFALTDAEGNTFRQTEVTVRLNLLHERKDDKLTSLLFEKCC